jgi:hypothetical protein
MKFCSITHYTHLLTMFKALYRCLLENKPQNIYSANFVNYRLIFLMWESGNHYPDDGGSKFFWNTGQYLPDYMVLHPRRQQSSYLPLWEPQISHYLTRFVCIDKVPGTRISWSIKLWSESVTHKHTDYCILQGETGLWYHAVHVCPPLVTLKPTDGY